MTGIAKRGKILFEASHERPPGKSCAIDNLADRRIYFLKYGRVMRFEIQKWNADLHIR
jgi:hypothetical protein